MATIVRRTFFVCISLIIFFPSLAAAQQLFLEPQNISNKESIYLGSLKISDPTQNMQRVYGKISNNQSDIYVFIPDQDGEVPLEFFIPEGLSEDGLKLLVVAKNVPEENFSKDDLGIVLPDGYKIWQIPKFQESYFDKYSFSFYSKNQEAKLKVEAKKNYFLIVIGDSNKQHYLISLGDNQLSSPTKQTKLLEQVLALKLDWFPGQNLPGLNFWSLLLGLVALVIIIRILRN